MFAKGIMCYGVYVCVYSLTPTNSLMISLLGIISYTEYLFLLCILTSESLHILLSLHSTYLGDQS